MIRDAKFADVPRLADILADVYARGIYAEHADLGTIDIREAKRILVQTIQRHGGVRHGSTFVQVSERAGEVEGFICGTLDRVQYIGTKLFATDIFFVGTKRMPARDPDRLLQSFVAWAKSAPDCVEITCGATKVAGDLGGISRLFARNDFSPHGVIFRRWLK